MPPTSTVLFASRLTVPLRLLVPVLVLRVPPLSVMASATPVTFCRSSVAPLATVVAPAVPPSALALLMARVPPLTLVAPL